MKQILIMKKKENKTKLSLEKLSITKLNNAAAIMGGSTDSDTLLPTHPTRTSNDCTVGA